jgi:hypothetical protein
MGISEGTPRSSATSSKTDLRESTGTGSEAPRGSAELCSVSASANDASGSLDSIASNDELSMNGELEGIGKEAGEA